METLADEAHLGTLEVDDSCICHLVQGFLILNLSSLLRNQEGSTLKEED
jgi:hypothetical protein